jgi:hypothetical protein
LLIGTPALYELGPPHGFFFLPLAECVGMPAGRDREVGYEVEYYQGQDPEGYMNHDPGRSYDLDVLVRNGALIAVQIKSSVGSADVVRFARTVSLFEQQTGRRVTKKVLVAGSIRPEARRRALDPGLWGAGLGIGPLVFGRVGQTDAGAVDHLGAPAIPEWLGLGQESVGVGGDGHAQALEGVQGKAAPALAVAAGAGIHGAEVVEAKEGLDWVDHFAAGTAGVEDLVEKAPEGAADRMPSGERACWKARRR